MAFLKQSKGLKDWASKFKIQAQYNLSIGAVTKGTGALGRSIRAVVIDSNTTLGINFFYNWYGDLVEAGGPFGPRRKFIKARPWFATTYKNLENDLVKVVEEGVVEMFEEKMKGI